MPRTRPPTSGYARIAQAEEEEEYLDNADADNPQRSNPTISGTHHQYAPIQPGRQGGMQPSQTSAESASPSQKKPLRSHVRHRSSSAVDIKAINARLEKWADEIASKFKIRKVKGKTQEEERLEIHHSVFQAPEGMRIATAESLASQYKDHHDEKMTKMQFDDIVESVSVAIELGVHPKMISQGSSGSYFARNSEGKVVGVFKPKDEEPYASRNPKWTKWLHRNLFPFAFGRACLIPNLSYVSEAAAYVLDTRLQTNLVPYTDIVYLSSISFNYDLWDRRAYYRKKKALPQKVGSFQVFLKGFQDANIFLKQYPWPDQQSSSLRASSGNKRKKRRWAEDCRPGSAPSDDEYEANTTPGGAEARRRKMFWTDELQQSFREELEKLVILDYIMRNTDRGLDNWMIKIDETTQKVSIVAEIPQKELSTSAGRTDEHSDPYRREDPMTTRESTAHSQQKPQVSIGAIDNSLSWPWKHPDAWRSFPFGWLFLPVSLIGQPFSVKTREHFLSLLTSKQWWSDTQVALRQCFCKDSDFQERMFARQIAVMKGQAWNVVETLKTVDHGPLELTRRARVCVWDDLVDIPTVVPLRVPSAEMRRRQEPGVVNHLDADEMDISTAHASAPHASQGLLRTSQPYSDLPNSSRFELSRYRSIDGDENNAFPEIGKVVSWDLGSTLKHAEELKTPHSVGPKMKTRSSFDGLRTTRSPPLTRRRNFSLTVRRPSDHDSDDADADGDLGYAAATNREGNSKKVIVERLETIKSKGPVFTWC